MVLEMFPIEGQFGASATRDESGRTMQGFEYCSVLVSLLLADIRS